MDPLLSSLLDLLFELRGNEPALTLGGGFGLYLKRYHLLATGERTLFDRLPEPRATNDLDLFVRAEILADLDRTTEIARAIRRLGYEPVEEARYLQWKRVVQSGGVPKEVKIDLLVGPLGAFRTRLHVSAPRVRPRGKSIEFHAHSVEEALGIDETPLGVVVDGTRTGGEPYRATVFVPQAFPYLMMKLYAFDDRKDDVQKDVGRHHALDLYTIVGMMTEGEYERARQAGRERATDPHVQRACAIVRGHFAARNQLGVIRLREHPLFRPDFALEEFMAVVREILPG
jgi:hypothetical protein